MTRLLPCAALVLFAACAARSAPPAHPARSEPAEPPAASAPAATDEVIELEPLRIEVVRDEITGETTFEATDARSLFDAGNEALVTGKHEEALGRYDRLLADFPDSSLVAPALYNAGLAHEAAGDFDAAIARYRELVRRQPTGRDSIDAHIRAAAVLAERERWTEATETLTEVLARADLSPSDRLEALARRGYVLLEARDLPAAEAQLAEAIAYHEREAAGGAHFETDYFLAMARYYYGEVPRRQFSAIPIRLPDEQIARDVEAKAELVILAGERFSAAIEVGNIYWATAAGYQLASMQHDFWTAVVTAPVPPHLEAEVARVYVAEVHKEVRNLLEKALSIHTKNVKLAEVYDTETPWSAASAREVERLTALLAREKAGELVTPTGDESGAPAAAQKGEYVPARFEL